MLRAAAAMGAGGIATDRPAPASLPGEPVAGGEGAAFMALVLGATQPAVEPAIVTLLPPLESPVQDAALPEALPDVLDALPEPPADIVAAIPDGAPLTVIDALPAEQVVPLVIVPPTVAPPLPVAVRQRPGRARQTPPAGAARRSAAR